VTQGIFEFLTEDEQRAVVGHELGHIVNRDFILMTMAGMLVQILYQIYAVLARSSQGSSDKKGKGAIVGIAALICYYIGIYLLLYLSRTREYLADAFSAPASSRSSSRARWSRSPTASWPSKTPTRPRPCSGARAISA